MSKSVHVIVLAGGYSTDIARGAAAAAAAAAPPTGTPRAVAAAAAAGTPRKLGGALSFAAARQAAGAAAVVPALLPLDGTPAVVRTLQALKSVRRVRLEAVWVVHNASDTAALTGPGGAFSAVPETGLGLPAVNFVSNGASGPHDWRGEVADLRSALIQIGSGSGACVAAISSELAFMPSYNMQRLLEHSYLRGRDTLGFTFLNGVDAAVLGTEGHTVLVPGEDSALPRIEELLPHSAAGPGMQVAEPFLFLRPESAAAVAAGGGGAVGSLQELAAAMMGGGAYVAGIDLMFGRYNLRSVLAVDYADRFFAFASAAALDPSSAGLRPDAVLQQPNTSPGGGPPPGSLSPPPAAGAITLRSAAATFQFSALEVGTGSGAATSSASLSDSLRGTPSDYEAFSRMAGAFNGRFFGEAGMAVKGGATGMKQYLLPPTFYMTAYRRQGADIMM